MQSVQSLQSVRMYLFLWIAQLWLGLASAGRCWTPETARGLVFAQYLEAKAKSENLFDWPEQSSSIDVQVAVKTIVQQQSDCYADEMEVVMQRLQLVEERLEQCTGAVAGGVADYGMAYGGGGEFGAGGRRIVDHYGGEFASARRMEMFQMEMMKHRHAIKVLRSRIAAMTRQCDGWSIV